MDTGCSRGKGSLVLTITPQLSDVSPHASCSGLSTLLPATSSWPTGSLRRPRSPAIGGSPTTPASTSSWTARTASHSGGSSTAPAPMRSRSLRSSMSSSTGMYVCSSAHELRGGLGCQEHLLAFLILKAPSALSLPNFLLTVQ